MDITSSEPSDEIPLAYSSTTGYEQAFLSFNPQNDHLSESEPIKELPPTDDPSELSIEHMLATLSSVDTASEKNNHEKCLSSFSGQRQKRLKLSAAILAGTSTPSSTCISLEHSEVMRCERKLKNKAVPIILRSRKMIHSPSSSMNIKQPVISNFSGNNSKNSGALNEAHSNEETSAVSNHSNLQESEKNCPTEAITSLNLDDKVADQAQKEYEKCQKCEKSVISTYKWQHVVNNHLKKAVYYCKYCNFTGNRTNNLLYHTREYHKGMPTECVSKIKEYEEEIKELLKECFCLKIPVQVHETPQDVVVVNTLVKQMIPVPVHETPLVVNALMKPMIPVPVHETPLIVVNALVKPMIPVPVHETPQDIVIVNTLVKENMSVPAHETSQDVVNTLLKEKIAVPVHETPQDVVDTLVKQRMDVLNTLVKQQETPQDVVNALVEQIFAKCQKMEESKKGSVEVNQSLNLDNIIADPPHKQTDGYCYCLKCHKLISWNSRNEHVIQVHLEKPVYCCKYCNYLFVYKDILEHIPKYHEGMPVKYVNKIDQFDDEIKELLNECFCLKLIVHEKPPECEVIKAQLNKQSFTLAQPQTLGESEKVGVEIIKVKRSNLDTKATDPPQKQCGCYCNKCQKSVPVSRLQHILHVHLGKAVYCCKYCDYTDSPGNLFVHIHTFHEKMPLEYVNKTEDYRDEIDQLLEECFGIMRRKEQLSVVKDFCFKCQKSLSTTSKRIHLLQAHLKQDVYFCKYCDYADQYSLGNLLNHIRFHHKVMPLKYENKLGEYQEKINHLAQQCYGMQKMKCETSCNKSKFKDEKGSLNVKTAKMHKGNGLKCKRFYCLKCQNSSPIKRRHILQVHLKRDIYVCKYCDYTTQYSTSCILYHVRNMHKEMPLEYKSMIAEYEDDIKKLEQECYGIHRLRCETNCNKRKSKNKKRKLNVGTENVHLGSGFKSKRFYCLKCQNSITNKRRHLLQIHLEKDIYLCKYCDYTHQYSMCRILSHVRHTHKEWTPEYKSRIGEYEDEIKKLQQECYGIRETSCKKRKLKDKKMRLNVQTSNVCHGSGLKSKLYYCQKCHKSSTYKRRHILQHLERDIYVCKYCDYAHKYCRSATLKHVRHMHKKMPLEYESRIGEYEAEIKKLEEECYGKTAKRNVLKCKRFYCLKCKKTSTSKRRHIHQVHLERDIYACKYCDYANKYRSKTLDHIRCMHKEMPAEYKTRIGEYEAEIKKLELECYGNSKGQHGSVLKCKRFYCLKCKKMSANKRRHILQHLERDIYACKYCDYTNMCRLKTLDHVRCMHKEMPPEYETRTGEFADEIKKLEQECYGMHTMKCEMSFNKRKSKEMKEQKSSQKQNERLYCLKCHQSFFFTYKRLHILQAHLKKDIYFCKYCDYTNQYLKARLLTHIGVHHKGMPVEYLDKLTEYKDEIDQLIVICYGSTKKTCIWCNKRFKARGFGNHQKACKSKNKSAVNTKSTSIDAGDDWSSCWTEQHC